MKQTSYKSQGNASREWSPKAPFKRRPCSGPRDLTFQEEYVTQDRVAVLRARTLARCLSQTSCSEPLIAAPRSI